ncbi:MAG TPA: sensor histidine kinase [Terriglobia bacterium]|nr:sensor histidine kinase [Terriglobia bacterium]
MPKEAKGKVLKTGQKSFDPKARLVSVLGEQLIRDVTVGLLELVKNAYDADSSQVQVRIVGTKRPETTQIVILDDGFGMDRETILTRWFEPATGEKEQEKKRGLRTPKFKRLPLGEKGVGRFAAHKLGRQLLLISRVEGAPTEVAVTVNWDDFDAAEKYLREVGVDWEEREPVYFTDDRHGTYLLVKQARSQWTEAEIKKVSNSLKRLMSPFRPPNDFKVTLHCPEYPKYQDLDPGDLLKRSPVQYYGAVDDHGNIDFEYSFNLPGFPQRKTEGKVDLRVSVGKSWGKPDRKPACGPFFASINVWNRRADILDLTRTSRLDLDAAFGVSVFRDGLRVLPYGEPDDDWLSLDQERYLHPTLAVGRKSIVGAIEISQPANPNLRDKTNREGLVENAGFLDFRALVKALLDILQKEWSPDRDLIEGQRKGERRPVARPALDRLSEQTVALSKALQAPLELAKRLEVEIAGGHPTADTAKELAESIKLLSAELPKVQETAAFSKGTLETAVDDLEHERDLLLGLAGMGLAAERFTHEFARLTREAHEILFRIEAKVKAKNPEVASDLDALSAIIDALRNDIKALGPMFYVRRTTREKELSVKSAIENARILNATALKEAKVHFEVDCPKDFTVVMREGPLTQIFNNLFDNATFWLDRKSDENDRRLRVVVDAVKREVLVVDNGPGVTARYKDRIFQPFFSMKTDGRGLGLYIVREILAERSGEIVLLEEGEHANMFPTGASFLIRFPEVKGERT